MKPTRPINMHENMAALGLSAETIPNLAVRTCPVLDIHTHLFPPAAAELCLWGIDALLTYHYLQAEALRHLTMSYEAFWKLDRSAQADLVWQTLFVERTPLSEACRGVITSLQRLGLDPAPNQLPALRRWFAEQDAYAHVDRCFTLAGVSQVFMTNSPWQPEEMRWRAGSQALSHRFRAALRLDTLFHQWPASAHTADGVNLACPYDATRPDPSRIKAYLASKVEAWGAEYLMLAWPPNGTLDDTRLPFHFILHEAILPFCEESGLALALMAGVRPGLNPALRSAGAGVANSRLAALEDLARDYPGVRFLLTVLARENQHQACVMARKFRNVHLFGCWWFMNNPSLVRETTAMRLEMLGPSFTAQHSDARVIEQLIYKWDHSREVVADVLQSRYADLSRSGWIVTTDDRKRDAAELLGTAGERFIRPAPRN
jgi:hypothetical protein